VNRILPRKKNVATQNKAGRAAGNGRSLGRTARRKPEIGDEELAPACGTAYAAEAMRTGVLPSCSLRRRDPLPHENERIRVGDPDDSGLANEYVGEETPGGTTPTPDQNDVDEIGRVYGLQDEDAGELHSAGEVLERRDKKRAELRPPRHKPR
jgi:hypothetical protein